MNVKLKPGYTLKPGLKIKDYVPNSTEPIKPDSRPYKFYPVFTKHYVNSTTNKKQQIAQKMGSTNTQTT